VDLRARGAPCPAHADGRARKGGSLSRGKRALIARAPTLLVAALVGAVVFWFLHPRAAVLVDGLVPIEAPSGWRSYPIEARAVDDRVITATDASDTWGARQHEAALGRFRLFYTELLVDGGGAGEDSFLVRDRDLTAAATIDRFPCITHPNTLRHDASSGVYVVSRETPHVSVPCGAFRAGGVVATPAWAVTPFVRAAVALLVAGLVAGVATALRRPAP
jgi:hypothetical protein